MSISRKGFFWSFVDSFAGQGIIFLTGIVLARILTPADFGLIGMLSIFIAISQSFVDSGFGNALIRKNNCTTSDYSTVFYFNLIVAVVLYVVLFYSSSYVALFYKQPLLGDLLRVLGLGLILNAAGLIQRVIFTKEVNFKAQTQVSFAASLVSGAVAITMAYNGFGVWSLIGLTLTRFGMYTILIWFKSTWRPSWIFSKKSFKEMFSFGSKLLLSGLLNTTYKNLNQLVIGKYYSAETLGYYSKAHEFNNIPTQNLNSIITRVSYPLLSKLQDNPQELKLLYIKLIRNIMFLTFTVLLCLGAVSENFVLTLVGEKWRQSAVYLSLLCFVGILFPLHAINLNMLQVQGRSDLFLRLEVIKKIMAIPVLVIGVWKGIEVLIIGSFINSCFAYYLNSFWSGRFINYSWKMQLQDIIPSFLFGLSVSIPVFGLGLFINYQPIVNLSIQLGLAVLMIVLLGELKFSKEYSYFRSILLQFLLKRRST